MRRSTPGGLTRDELLERHIARAEAHDPERVVRLLEPLVLERRRERLREVIDRRLASVTVVMDQPYDPHNGAAVVRSCEAFGIQRLHVVEKGRVPFLVAGPVARGSQKWIDVSIHAAPEAAAETVRREGFELVAAHPEGELAPDDLGAIPRVALVLGNERDGIREALMQACTRRVRVPMRGFVESLNMSVTGAILMHAATRGRPGDLGARDRLRLYARGLYLTVPHAEEALRDEAFGGQT